jgi:hypothetical protein
MYHHNRWGNAVSGMAGVRVLHLWICGLYRARCPSPSWQMTSMGWQFTGVIGNTRKGTWSTATIHHKSHMDHSLRWDTITNLKGQGPSWRANRSSVSNEISRILCNPKVHYRIHKCRPPWLEPDQSSPYIPSRFLDMRFNIFLPSISRF